MSSVIERLLAGYETEGIIAMPYTIEDFRNEMKQRALKMMTPEEIVKAFSAEKIFGAFSAEERLRGLPAEERLRGLSPEEIRVYLKKLPKKAAPAKKKVTKMRKSSS